MKERSASNQSVKYFGLDMVESPGLGATLAMDAKSTPCDLTNSALPFQQR